MGDFRKYLTLYCKSGISCYSTLSFTKVRGEWSAVLLCEAHLLMTRSIKTASLFILKFFRNIARFTGAHITGLNLNAYQVRRSNLINEKTLISSRLNCVEVRTGNWSPCMSIFVFFLENSENLISRFIWLVYVCSASSRVLNLRFVVLI